VADRTAQAQWQGNLPRGNGEVTLESSGLGTFAVSWASRTEAPDGKTSPEELIAAAHASCFSMAFAHGLSQAGAEVRRLETSATVTFGQVEGGFAITRSAITVRGEVDGVSADDFQAAADAAKEGCPVSKALQGNVELSVDATLA
jgi:osmotically inducible protein OsmC